jgi:PKD repeat protein
MLVHPCGLVRLFVRLGTVAAFVSLSLAPPIAAAATINVPAGGDLQAAINAAQPGDSILLEPGATYVGNFVLPVKPGATYIVIRTAPDPSHPLPGDRVSPAHAPRLAKLRSPSGDATVMTAAGAHHWRLELLDIGPTVGAYGEIVRLGRGGADQNTLASVPYEIVIDRCYIHGDSLLGQKRGIGLNSAATTVINSYISEIKGVGMDTQAICGWNGPGPFVIANNYLEGSGENVMFGGADPYIRDLVPSDITFRGNHLSKPRTWQQPIIPTPSPAAIPLPGGGTLAAGTYAYRVVARRPIGQGSMGTSAASVDVTATLSQTGGVSLSWASIEYATEYRIYGRTAGSQTSYWTVAGTTFVDTGASGTAGAPPAGGSRWTVKNIFELKNARRVTVEGNVFEHSWRDAQIGVGVVMTPRNDGGNAPWATVQDITFRYNLIRHVGGAINVNGYDTVHSSGPGRNFLIQHNLAYDVRAEDGMPGRFLTIGSGPSNVVVDHNTAIQNSTLVFVYGRNTDGSYDVVEGFRFSNNLGRHNDYGIMGELAGGYGNTSILTYFLDLATVTHNVMAGGPASRYPADNWFPTLDAFMAEFADDTYRLRPDSTFRGAGNDGLDLGADVEEIWARADLALRGTASPNAAPVAAPGGPYSALTSTPITFDGTGSVDPDGTIVSYVWHWADGTPQTQGPDPTHAYARPGTYPVTLTVTDDDGVSATASTNVVIGNRPPVAEAGGPYTIELGGTVAVHAGGSADPDGQVVSYRWMWADLSPDTIASDPAASHVYANPGDYQVVLTVTDDSGASATDTTNVRVEAGEEPPTSPPDVVLYAADVPPAALHGAWVHEPDAGAAGGVRLGTPDRGWAANDAPLANPTHYFDASFNARAAVDYRVWVRLSATRDSKWNDAVWLQFSDAMNASGTPLYRIGSAEGLLVNLAPTASAKSLHGWGWANGAYWLQQTTAVRFASDGTHTVRVQVREDGVRIDQVVLSAEQYWNVPPGAVRDDTTIVVKPLGDVVVYARDVTGFGESWELVDDPTAAGGSRLSSVNQGWSATEQPPADPTRYFDVTVQTQANVDYRAWVRLAALGNSKYNDAVWLQFSGASAGGTPRYEIGTADGLLVNLATTVTATSLSGWGWADGAYWLAASVQPSVLRFAAPGPNQIRVSVREDGVSLDQIVLSPVTFMSSAPGEVTADTTIVSKP